jgi:hypothetical protein
LPSALGQWDNLRLFAAGSKVLENFFEGVTKALGWTKLAKAQHRDLFHIQRDQVHRRVMVRTVPTVPFEEAIHDVLPVGIFEVCRRDRCDFRPRCVQNSIWLKPPVRRAVWAVNSGKEIMSCADAKHILNPFRFVVIALAGWINQKQQHAIEYLRE